MKAVNVNASIVTADVAKTSTSPTVESAGMDFLALVQQTMADGNATAELAVSLARAALPIAEQLEDDKGGGFDEADLAALMATLAGASSIPATTSPVAREVTPNMLAARTRGAELTTAVTTTLVTAEQAAKAQVEEPGFDTLSSPSEPGTVTGIVDTRLSHTALDAVRDARGTQPADAPVHRQLHSTVGTRAWTEELGHQITWLTDRGQQTASLRLAPEHLGPLEIQISIQDDKASIWFGAAHADTRAAIEGALPRLREMLASQGLALNDAGVFKESPRQQGQQRAERASSADAVTGVEEVQAARMVKVGLVDAYA